MLIDHRTYTLRPGTLRKQIEIYEKYGLIPQKRHCGEPLAWKNAETGYITKQESNFMTPAHFAPIKR